MARKVREEDYTGKRNEILDAAQKLIYTRGYEQMTIQGILDEARISKGAFYHYFDSKQDLLEALIDRMLEEGERLLKPIVEDPRSSATGKATALLCRSGTLEDCPDRFFNGADAGLVSGRECDRARENIPGRNQTSRTGAHDRFFYQGLEEGSMTTGFPEEVGEVVMCLVEGLGETFARTLLSKDPGSRDLEQIRRITNAYQEALERVLGAPEGSLTLVDDEMMETWFGLEKEKI